MQVWFHLRFDGHKYFVEHQDNSSWNSICNILIKKFKVSSNMHPFNTFSLGDTKNSTGTMPLH